MVKLNRWEKHIVDGKEHYPKNNDNIEPEKEITINNIKYFLKSVIEHSGISDEIGHYTASCLQENGTWVKCDDMTVSQSYLPEKGYVFL